MRMFLAVAAIVCIIFADARNERRINVVHEDVVRLEQRLTRIEADLDALKHDVAATGIACEETRSRR